MNKEATIVLQSHGKSKLPQYSNNSPFTLCYTYAVNMLRIFWGYVLFLEALKLAPLKLSTCTVSFFSG